MHVYSRRKSKLEIPKRYPQEKNGVVVYADTPWVKDPGTYWNGSPKGYKDKRRLFLGSTEPEITVDVDPETSAKVALIVEQITNNLEQIRIAEFQH